MSHFAKVFNGIVEQIIVAEQDFIDTLLDKDLWIKTSYNTKGGVHYDQNNQPDGDEPLRGNYAGIGFTYDSINDVFISPKPLDINGLVCESWTVNAPTWLWESPIPMPKNDKAYLWDEKLKSWVEVQKIK